MGTATDRHFELNNLIQNYRLSDRKKCIQFCEEGVDNLAAFVTENGATGHLTPSTLFLPCIEFLVPIYAQMGQYDMARIAVRKTLNVRAWTDETAQEKMAWIDSIEKIHRDAHHYISLHPGVKAKDVYPLFPQHNPELMQWFFDNSDYIRKDKDGRFIILFATDGNTESTTEINSVVNKFWEFPDKAYIWVKGIMSKSGAGCFQSFILSNYQIEETERRMSKDYLRLRFWEDNTPGQISIYHKRGEFTLLCSVDSSAYDELMKYNPTIHLAHETDARNLAWFISDIHWQEKNTIIRAYMTAHYTEQDKVFYETLAVENNNVPYPLVPIHFDPYLKIPQGEVNSKKYKQAYDLVQGLFIKYGRANTERWIHMFVQGISEWNTTLGDIIFPTVPDKPRFSLDSNWAEIAKVVNSAFLNMEEEEIIQFKMYHDMTSDTFKVYLSDKWHHKIDSLMDELTQHVDDELINQVRGLIPNPIYDPMRQIETYLSKLQLEYRKKLPTGTCIFCNAPLLNIYPSHNILAALRGDTLSICGECLQDAVGPQPWGSKRRPFVRTREELVSVVRELAMKTGVLPSSQPLKFLSQVPKEKLLIAITLLRHLPYDSLRRDIYPEGWSQILADTGLLDEESRIGIGIRCVAEDGHVCRSLSEKFIDDWLHRNGIAHDIEPPYPFDHELNTNGMRADFLVRDVWIEFFGLMTRPEYEAKAKLKKRLVQKYGLKLIDLYMADLTDERLTEKLGHLI